MKFVVLVGFFPTSTMIRLRTLTVLDSDPRHLRLGDVESVSKCVNKCFVTDPWLRTNPGHTMYPTFLLLPFREREVLECFPLSLTLSSCFTTASRHCPCTWSTLSLCFLRRLTFSTLGFHMFESGFGIPEYLGFPPSLLVSLLHPSLLNTCFRPSTFCRTAHTSRYSQPHHLRISCPLPRRSSSTPSGPGAVPLRIYGPVPSTYSGNPLPFGTFLSSSIACLLTPPL